jgi:hypothetical protein
MLYRPDIDEVIDRYKRFYEPGSDGQLLITVAIPKHILGPAPGESPRPRLNEYNFDTQNEEYLDGYIEYFESKFRIRMGIKDDYIPAICPYYGYAQDCVYLAGDPIFGPDTSWVKPVIEDWSVVETLKFNPDNYWVKKIQYATKYIAEKSKGRFVPTDLLNDGPFDLAHTLRGNDFFTDFSEYPDKVHHLMEVCTEAIMRYKESQRKFAGRFEGGSVAGWGVWLPGGTVFIGEDTAGLCSPAIYAKFGRKYTQKVIDHFGGGYVHTHAYGMHIIREIGKLEDLKMVQISHDHQPAVPAPVDKLEDFRQCAEKLPLHLECSPEELKTTLPKISGRKILFTTWAANVNEANQLVEMVRGCQR